MCLHLLLGCRMSRRVCRKCAKHNQETLAFLRQYLMWVFPPFQDRDLERLRRKWLCALTKRQEYLDQQLQKLVGKPGKEKAAKGKRLRDVHTFFILICSQIQKRCSWRVGSGNSAVICFFWGGKLKLEKPVWNCLLFWGVSLCAGS